MASEYFKKKLSKDGFFKKKNSGSWLRVTFHKIFLSFQNQGRSQDNFFFQRYAIFSKVNLRSLARVSNDDAYFSFVYYCSFFINL